MIEIKKNCENCDHLRFFEPEYESFESAGFYCEGREYKYDTEEDRHLDKLQDSKYRNRSKKCFKDETNQGVE